MIQFVLDLITEYYRKHKPATYLFNGQFDLKYSDSSIRQFLNKYAKIAEIRKKVHPHLIRHCYGTHQIESGMDSIVLQDILGHKKIETTNIYKHLATNHFLRLSNPLTQILQP